MASGTPSIPPGKVARLASNLSELFLLDPSVVFLNHGSFGACPRPVFEDYQRWQLKLERQPVEFLDSRRGLGKNLSVMREAMAAEFGTSSENIAAVTNFVVTPLSFLSGTFYSVDSLPGVFWWVAHADPFFYMIDGFRYGFVGRADGALWLGVIVMAGVNAGLWWLALRMFKTGYKLKA